MAARNATATGDATQARHLGNIRSIEALQVVNHLALLFQNPVRSPIPQALKAHLLSEALQRSDNGAHGRRGGATTTAGDAVDAILRAPAVIASMTVAHFGRNTFFWGSVTRQTLLHAELSHVRPPPRSCFLITAEKGPCKEEH